MSKYGDTHCPYCGKPLVDEDEYDRLMEGLDSIAYEDASGAPSSTFRAKMAELNTWLNAYCIEEPGSTGECLLKDENDEVFEKVRDRLIALATERDQLLATVMASTEFDYRLLELTQRKLTYAIDSLKLISKTGQGIARDMAEMYLDTIAEMK